MQEQTEQVELPHPRRGSWYASPLGTLALTDGRKGDELIAVVGGEVGGGGGIREEVMPWERFEAQTEEKKKATLQDGVPVALPDQHREALTSTMEVYLRPYNREAVEAAYDQFSDTLAELEQYAHHSDQKYDYQGGYDLRPLEEGDVRLDRGSVETFGLDGGYLRKIRFNVFTYETLDPTDYRVVHFNQSQELHERALQDEQLWCQPHSEWLAGVNQDIESGVELLRKWE